MHTKPHTKKPRDFDRGPVTMILNGFSEIAKVHVRAKFHQANCSGSRVIVLRKKKTQPKTILPLPLVTVMIAVTTDRLSVLWS